MLKLQINGCYLHVVNVRNGIERICYMKIRIKAVELIAAVTTVLTACGGGIDSGSASGTLSGVAAVGSPIVSGVINISCASGPIINSTTTDSDGAWKSTISGHTLPCAVQVSGGTVNGFANTTQYHSIATNFGIVNVTPLTDLMVANLIGSVSPGSWFAGLPVVPTSLVNIKSAQVTLALDKLRTAIPVLASLSTINPITTSFKPISGDVSDDMLSALKAALTLSQVTYASLLNCAADTVFSTPPSNFSIALALAYTGPASNVLNQPVGETSISGVFPSSAVVGQQVVISGANFAAVPGSLLSQSGAAYQVSFNGAIVTPFFRTPTQLGIMVPAGATSGTLTVKDLNTNRIYSLVGGFTVAESTTSTTPKTVFLAIPANGAFTSTPNNVTIDFIDLVGANVAIDNANITVQITVRNLPQSLTFNQAAVPAQYLEYEWAIDFDINNDGVADYTISMSEYNLGVASPTTKSISAGTQVLAWNHQGFISSTIASSQPSINGNTISLSIPKSASSELVNITSNAKVNVRTFYRSSVSTSFKDSL